MRRSCEAARRWRSNGCEPDEVVVVVVVVRRLNGRRELAVMVEAKGGGPELLVV